MKRAFLVIPPTGQFAREDRCQTSASDLTINILRPPLDLMYMATGLEKEGMTCKIFDYPTEKASWNKFGSDLKSFNPDMLIVSTTVQTVESDLEACRIAKKFNKKILTMAKGPYLSYNDNDFSALKSCSNLDIVMRKEFELIPGEVVSKKLSEVKGITYRKGKKTIRNKDRDITDVNDLPIPARHLINNSLYKRIDTGEPMAIIETSRGCPFTCTYCLAPIVNGRKIRTRKIDKVLEEIKICEEEFGITNFHFKSDIFTGKKIWVKDLCNELIRQNLNINWICNSRVNTFNEELASIMSKSGCIGIAFGIESGSKKTLEIVKKKTTLEQARKAIKLCKKYGIKSFAHFIIGFPWESKKDIEETINFSIKLNPDFADFYFPFPFRNTEFYTQIKEKGYKLDSDLLESAAPSANIAIPTEHLSEEELLALRKKGIRKFYSRPSKIAAPILAIRDLKSFLNITKEGFKLLRKLWQK